MNHASEAEASPELSRAAMPRGAVSRFHDGVALSALILISAIFFADVLSGRNNFYMRDLTRFHYPIKKVLRGIVLNGEFPYWNRLFSAGQPMAANPQYEVFYPLTWLYFLPDYDFAFRLSILIHVWIGLAGMYALLRSMELRPPAAFFGALSFGLGGTYLSYINLLPILFCAAWLPLVCLFVRRFLINRRSRDFALAALCLGLQFLVAEPTTVMQTGLIIGMYALYRGWHSEQRIRAMISNVFAIAAISATAFAVGAAQMLPAIDHARDSIRIRGLPFSVVQQWSMPWAKMAEILYPNVLGHISINQSTWYWGGGLYEGGKSPFLYSIYPGLGVAVLAVAGMLVRRRGGLFVMALALTSVLIALGANTPLLRILYDAGIAGFVRYPEKFILIGVFALTVFAAQMLQRVIDGDRDLRDAAGGLALATAVIALAVAACNYASFAEGLFLEVWGLDRHPSTLHMVSLAWAGWKTAVARGLVLFLILLLFRTRRRLLWLAGAALFLLADLLPVVHELNPRVPRRFFTESVPLASTLPANRLEYRVFHEVDWYLHDKTTEKFFSASDAVYWVTRNGLYPMTLAGQGIAQVLERDYDLTGLLPTIDLTDSLWELRSAGRPDWAELIMSMSNGWFRGVYKDFEKEIARAGGDLKTTMPIEFKEGPHYPRYYFAQEIVQIRDRKHFVETLKQRPPGLPAPRAFTYEPSFVPSPGRVLGWRETANDAVIDVESAGRGFLIMSVTTHKYWRIFIDGNEVRPVVTNVAYQGIPVPRGRHTVTMRYRNPLIKAGASISSAAILILLAVPLKKRPKEA